MLRFLPTEAQQKPTWPCVIPPAGSSALALVDKAAAAVGRFLDRWRSVVPAQRVLQLPWGRRAWCARYFVDETTTMRVMERNSI
jgi:hypothetical protein